MEQQKNFERFDSTQGELSSSLQDQLSLHAQGLGSLDNEDELPDNLLQSFCTETDEDLLQKEYDMLSSGSINELVELNEGGSGNEADGDIVNGVYFDKLELELNAIEQAMEQFEGRLDSLREQAQDLLLTLQNERMATSTNPDKTEDPTHVGLETTREKLTVEEKGSGDD